MTLLASLWNKRRFAVSTSVAVYCDIHSYGVHSHNDRLDRTIDTHPTPLQTRWQLAKVLLRARDLRESGSQRLSHQAWAQAWAQ